MATCKEKLSPMTRPIGSGFLSWRNLALVAGAWLAYAAVSPGPLSNAADVTQPRWQAGKYIGAGKCKNCHGKEATGNQYAKWLEMEHAKAWETLASKDALEVGKKAGVDKPQESAKCLKCHVTAYEAPAETHASLDPKMGIQCESCHGPGGSHLKARMAAAAESEEESGEPQTVGKGEILLPGLQNCQACHNKESPEFKEFKCAERMEKVLHLNPKRKRDQKKVIADLCK